VHGIEVLVAADLTRTVAVTPTPGRVAVLVVIVLIRTFPSFSMVVEIDGMPPWGQGSAAPSAAGQSGNNW
jgi:uncharacterized membrane protein